MHSLFEEQLIHEQMAAHRFIDARVDMDAETQGIRRAPGVFSIDAGRTSRSSSGSRSASTCPVLASLNGTTPGGWTSFAKRLESAGADAIELNLYEVATSPDETRRRGGGPAARGGPLGGRRGERCR
jgi:dihydroorotate dehydrogenase (fumarate)